MTLPTGRLGITGSMKGEAPKHKTFELGLKDIPHSARQAKVSADYHGKTHQCF